ncbi:FecR family protein [Aquimarina sp. W85]|uniref:FecR family protein n=1 Tax=Aquimarina rhodophyticola TaxID=3342246 RepID=UPI00367205D4
MKNEDLVKKWLSDNLSPIEKKQFEASEDYFVHKTIVDTAKFFKADHVTTSQGVAAVRERAYAQKKPVVKTKFYRSSWLIFVLLFLIIIGIGSFFFFSNDTTIYTDIGENMSIKLPDNSHVTLNSKSTVSFDQKGWSKQREVNLEGEAYFEVAQGKNFEVLTDAGTISVLGTKFNVKNRNNFFEVHCFEGMVHVRYKNGYTENLSAGNSLRIIDGIITFETSLDKSPQWINKISNFKNVPFAEVIKEFERQYKVKLIVQDVDTQRGFTGDFMHNDVEEGLKSITLPFNLSYRIDNEGNIVIAPQ